MIRIKPLHTRIFNDILSLVTKPQCGISVHVSHQVLLTHCQEPFSGRPTKFVCALMPWWLFPVDPRCSALICCTACFIVLTNLHARIEPVAGWKMSLVGWEKNVWKTQEQQNPWIFLLVLLYCAAFPLLFLFLLLLYSGVVWYCPAAHQYHQGLICGQGKTEKWEAKGPHHLVDLQRDFLVCVALG